jgi:hypothetical protein
MNSTKDFIVWDMQTKGLKSLMEVLKDEAFDVPGIDERGGDLSRRVLHNGILNADRIFAFANLPNANVGYEFGYALGAAKSLAVLYTTSQRPDWLRLPPMSGILCNQIGAPEDVLKLGEQAFWTGPPWEPSDREALLLCPKGIEGSSIKYALRKEYEHWHELPEDGWNIIKLPELLGNFSISRGKLENSKMWFLIFQYVAVWSL